MAPEQPIYYDALVVPTEALEKGGIEILRAGLVDDELYVTARRVFNDPATWGEVLAEMARRLARVHSAGGEYKESEVLAAIQNAFAADLGAPVIKEKAPRARRTRKTSARAAPARKPARRTSKKRAKPAKRSKR